MLKGWTLGQSSTYHNAHLLVYTTDRISSTSTAPTTDPLLLLSKHAGREPAGADGRSLTSSDHMRKPCSRALLRRTANARPPPRPRPALARVPGPTHTPMLILRSDARGLDRPRGALAVADPGPFAARQLAEPNEAGVGLLQVSREPRAAFLDQQDARAACRYVRLRHMFSGPYIAAWAI